MNKELENVMRAAMQNQHKEAKSRSQSKMAVETTVQGRAKAFVLDTIAMAREIVIQRGQEASATFDHLESEAENIANDIAFGVKK